MHALSIRKTDVLVGAEPTGLGWLTVAYAAGMRLPIVGKMSRNNVTRDCRP
jgi:hypothetical protein